MCLLAALTGTAQGEIDQTLCVYVCVLVCVDVQINCVALAASADNSEVRKGSRKCARVIPPLTFAEHIKHVKQPQRRELERALEPAEWQEGREVLHFILVRAE